LSPLVGDNELIVWKSRGENRVEAMNTPEKWLSVEEIADHLGISKETVYRWLEKGGIPAHRIGKLWKFRPSEVDRWVTKGGAEESPVTSKPKSRTAKKGI